jgi:spore maturation protein CgeB
MRILIVDTCYPAFVKSHYERNPGLERATYDEQWRALMATSFGTSDAYSHFLEPLGHPAHEVVVDCDALQAAWAAEHDLGGADRERTLLAQAAVLSDSAMRELRSGGAFVVGQIASEPPAEARVRGFDLILTSFPHFVERFRGLGIASEYFRIGFDPRVLDRLGDVDRRHEIVFAGALNRLRHRRGNEAIARAARRLPVELWGYDLRGWPPWSIVRRRYHGEAWGLDMYRVLASSRIALNRHIGVAGEYANNMRLYEATGVGALLLTDAKTNLHELFALDEEVVAYTTTDELVEKARHYLDHPDELHAVAAAGQARTLRDHSYAVRMRELVDLIEAHRR